MKESIRLAATIIIWIALAAVLGSTLTSPTGAIGTASGPTVLGVVAVLAFAAMVSTVAVWFGGGRSVAQTPDETHFAQGKHKRIDPTRLGQDRLARLIDSLEDEDIYDLEALLLARDQESRTQRR